MSDEQHISPFEQIRHETEEGGEYWSARELSKVLGYLNWRNFEPVIEKAETACAGSGHAISDHFARARTLIETGKGARREVDDVQLSRYACYLVVQNADPSKEIVALGQTYFAVQTRRAELGDELTGLSEAQRRLYIRGQVTDHNKRLADAAQDVGVVTSRDFAIFQDHGYMGLYNGERARDIHARKALKKGQQILDWMDSEELAANLFRATQTEAKLRREEFVGKEAANQTHFAVGREVRETIKRLGGTMPEDLLTPSESIQQVRKREVQAIEARRQPSLFDPDQPE